MKSADTNVLLWFYLFLLHFLLCAISPLSILDGCFTRWRDLWKKRVAINGEMIEFKLIFLNAEYSLMYSFVNVRLSFLHKYLFDLSPYYQQMLSLLLFIQNRIIVRDAIKGLHLEKRT